MEPSVITVLLVTGDKALHAAIGAACAAETSSVIRLECVPPSKAESYWRNDLCLLDAAAYRAGRPAGLEKAITRIKGVPAIVILRDDSEKAAFDALRAGAADYVRRSDAAQPILIHAIRRAWLRRQVAEESGTFRGLRDLAEESEEKYRAVIESAGEPIAVYDEAGLCHFMNNVGAERLGITPEDAIGRTMWDLFPQVAAEAQMQPIREVIQQRAPKTMEYESVIRSERRWYHARIVPLKNRAEKTTKALVFAVDITQIKRMQEALREREEAAREFQQQLKALHEVTTTLSTTRSFDDLCRQAIELGRAQLGFDRLGLWFLQDDAHTFHGSFGVDTQGRLCDERNNHIPIAPGSPWHSIVSEKQTIVVVPQGTICDNAGAPLAPGWSAFAALQEGQNTIGVMTSDNLLSHAPLQGSRLELMTLYASSVGHLCSIRKREDSARHFQDQLMALSQATTLLTQTGSLDELWRQAVELGQRHLGFDRLGIWLIAQEPRQLHGSYGIDEHGSIRDERERRYVVESDDEWREFLAKDRIVVPLHNQPLRDDTSTVVGSGDFASATLWDGESVVGCITVDNLLSREPITEIQCRILTLYASAVGGLCAIRRRNEELQLFRSVIESSEEAIAVCDHNGSFVYANRAHNLLFGLDAKNATTRETLDNLYPPDSLETISREILPALERGETWEGELMCRNRPGRLFPVWQRIDSVRDPAGALQYAFGIMHDISKRRAAEDAIRQSEERFRMHYKHFPLPTVTWRWTGQDFELSNYNDAMLELTRGQIGEYIGISATTLHGDEPDILDALKQCCQTQRTVHREIYKALKTTGERKLLDVTYVFAPPDSVMAHLEDITEREKAVRALRQSEARYRDLLDCMADTVWRADMDGRLTFISPVVKQMAGYEPEELLGQPFDVVLTPQSAAEARESLLRRVRGELEGEGLPLELTFRRKDGSQFIGEVRPSTLRDPDGRLIGIQGITRDFTERKRAEQALRDSEERYRTLVEYSPDAIVVVDARNNRFVDANAVAESLFGRSKNELLRIGPAGISPPEQPDGTPSPEAGQIHIQRALSGELATFEWIHRNASGNDIPCEVRLMRVPPANQQLVRASITDITERKRIERTIAEQRAKMITASRLSSLGVMASGVAHEINNPLAIISAGAEQLADLVNSRNFHPERIDTLTGSIRRNVARIERIVRGLRNLSRDSEGDPFRQTPLNAIIDETLELCRARFLARDIALTVLPAPESTTIECRPTLISQVLLNLLNNAYDAVETLPERWVRLEPWESDDEAGFSVTDSGPLITPELCERIFEPFFSTKEIGKGTGLGLGISRGIVESHGGSLILDPESPNTRFVVRIPRRQHPKGALPNA